MEIVYQFVAMPTIIVKVTPGGLTIRREEAAEMEGRFNLISRLKRGINVK